jgi:hypothetical protein
MLSACADDLLDHGAPGVVCECERQRLSVGLSPLKPVRTMLAILSDAQRRTARHHLQSSRTAQSTHASRTAICKRLPGASACSIAAYRLDDVAKAHVDNEAGSALGKIIPAVD